MLNTISSIITLVVAIISAYFALGYYKVRVKVSAEKMYGKKIELSDVLSTGMTILYGIGIVILEAGFASASIFVTAIALAGVLIAGIISISNSNNTSEAKLTTTFFGWLGAPLSAGIVMSVLKKFQQFGWDLAVGWKNLFWLLAPVVFYIALAIALLAVSRKDENADEEVNAGQVIAISVVALAAVCLGISLFSIFGVKSVVPEEITAEEEPAVVEEYAIGEEETEAEPEENITTLEFDAKAEAEKAHAILLNSISGASEEEKAIFKSGKAVGQLDETDEDIDIDKILEQFEMPKSEEARKEAREGYKALLNDYDGPEKKIEIYPRWESSPVNLETMSAEDPETGNTLTYERTHSGWLHGFVKKVISWATGRIFDSKKNDEASFREETTDNKIKHYEFFVELLEIYGYEATVLGKPMYEVFPFFAEGKKIADRNQEEGVGVYGVLENIGTVENPKYKYTEEWTDIMADFYLWLDHVSYEGTYEWWTRERGYLGPADGTVREELQHDFDYSSVADNRANFTTDTARQTNLPSEIFCLRDKQSGYRVSDFMGINIVTSDAELYIEAAKSKKTTLDKVKDGGGVTVIDYTLPTKQQAAAATKVTYTASTGEVKNVPTPTPTPKKNPTPTPSKKKDPAKSSVNNPNNDYGQKNDPATEAQDEWTKTWVQPASSVVAEAQGGNNSDYTQAIENGTWTPSGTNDALDLSTPAGIADATTPWVNPETGNTVTPVVTETTSDGIGGQDTYEPAPDSVATSNDQNYTDNNSVENPVQEYKEPETKEEGGDVGEKTDNTGGVDNADSEVQEENQFF